MRQSLILGIVLVVLVLVFYIYNYSEGFETLEDKIQDRTNAWAGEQNPITNPAANIGISESAGAALRNIATAALNMPTAVADGAGSYKQAMPGNTISPRIDNENSYLGMIKMCKAKGVGETPFSDSEFNESCGMCITSGRLKTGEDFNTPTGVLVYRKDKEDAMATKVQNAYIFNRAMPSVDSAICDGASKDDNAIPVLAINQEDYDAFRKRKVCRDAHKIGEQCGRCLSDNESTWISPSGGKQPLTLYLWGSGKATVRLSTGITSNELSLSESSKSTVAIGKAEEGTGLQISVLKVGVDEPYLYGVIASPTAAKGIYQLPIEKFMELDTVSGSAPRRNGVKYFEDVKVFCTKLMPQTNKDSMNLSGFIPMTLVEGDQLAAFDCPSAPLVQTEGGADFLIDDPCLKPRGQGPGNYSEECIRQAILQGGCSTNGDWYKNPPKNVMNLTDFVNDIRAKSLLTATDPAISMGCKGIDISTPCDAYLNGGVPGRDCLRYLYSNKSEGTRVGRAYKNADTKYASMIENKIAFCRPGGSLNPQTSPNAVATLQGIAGGYKGVSGIEAVKMYLSDVFTKAVGNLDANVDDDRGGRKTSWQQCIGMKIADIPIINADVTTNSIDDVIDNRNEVEVTEFAAVGDFIMITYQFVDGRDLDTKTRISAPYQTDYLGYGQGNNGRGILSWGGDNTDTGFEGYLIDLTAHKRAGYGERIKIEFRAHWFGTNGNLPVRLAITVFKGGQMIRDGFKWRNPTATNTTELFSGGKIITQRYPDGQFIGTLTYNMNSGVGTVDVSQQSQDLATRLIN